MVSVESQHCFVLVILVGAFPIASMQFPPAVKALSTTCGKGSLNNLSALVVRAGLATCGKSAPVVRKTSAVGMAPAVTGLLRAAVNQASLVLLVTSKCARNTRAKIAVVGECAKEEREYLLPSYCLPPPDFRWTVSTNVIGPR